MKGWAMAGGFFELYQRAVNGDRRAQGDLWKEYRERMLGVIRHKANDLQMHWAVELDDIYDSFFCELFDRKQFPNIPNAAHFANYVAKSLRRTTKRMLQARKRQNDIRLNDLPDEATAITVFNEFEWEEQLNVLEARLSQRERDLCSLVKERYTWREIGEKMGLAEDSARMTYRRALSRIQKELSEGGEFKSGGRVARTD